MVCGQQGRQTMLKLACLMSLQAVKRSLPQSFSRQLTNSEQVKLHWLSGRNSCITVAYYNLTQTVFHYANTAHSKWGKEMLGSNIHTNVTMQSKIALFLSVVLMETIFPLFNLRMKRRSYLQQEKSGEEILWWFCQNIKFGQVTSVINCTVL